MKIRKVMVTLEIDSPEVTVCRVRGYFATKFRDFILLHHHTPSGHYLWRYPLVQYKILNGAVQIIGFERGGEVLETIYPQLATVNLNGHESAIVEKGIRIEEASFGMSDRIHTYRFLIPWIAFNGQNAHRYKGLSDPIAQRTFLTDILIANILTLCKGLDYHASHRIELMHDLHVAPDYILFKQEILQGFLGIFHTNFLLPDLIGVGRIVSKGYGTVQRITDGLST